MFHFNYFSADPFLGLLQWFEKAKKTFKTKKAQLLLLDQIFLLLHSINHFLVSFNIFLNQIFLNPISKSHYFFHAMTQGKVASKTTLTLFKAILHGSSKTKNF